MKLLDYFIFSVYMTGIIAGVYRYNLDHKVSWLIGAAVIIGCVVHYLFSIRNRIKLERLIETIK